jgi:hypothetical protein
MFDVFIAVRRAEAAAFADVDESEIIAAHKWRY